MSSSRAGTRRWPAPVFVVAALVPFALWLWWQQVPLPSPEEGAGMLVAAAGREHPGATATCRVIDTRDDEVLGCRMRDAAGRYGWGSVWVGTTLAEDYRGGEHERDVLRHTHAFPVSADGVAELPFTDPRSGPGPTGADTLRGILTFLLRDPLRAAGHDALAVPDCPAVAPGGTVRCTVTGVPATVEVTRPGAGGEHLVRLTVRPLP